MKTQETTHIFPYRLFVNVWLALLLLTVVTIGVSFLDLQKLTIFTAMLIATVKATLVILYFMHIRFDSKMYTWIIIATLGIYSIFIILTFSDYFYRPL